MIDSGDSYFMSPSQLVGSIKETRTIQRQRQLPDGRRVITNTQQRIWIDIAAEGRTPMRAAFTTVHQQLRRWIACHKDAFPPIVINITDGEATDGSPDQIRDIAEHIKSLSTTDGNVLIMNVHLSEKSEKSIIFPYSISDLPEDQYARLIYDISSPMPPVFQQEISQQHHQTTPQAYRGMAYNASISDLVRLITIGSTTINQNVTT